MREIKFKVWNKIRKVMSYDVTLYANGWVECVFEDGTEDKFPPRIAKEILVIMQYVGLKDKNGREIYEGDIFKAKHAGIYEYIGHVYYEDCFGFKIMNYHVFGWPEYKKNYTFWIKAFIEHFPLEHVEVIGNIFENPELLEG